jgi:hypothetical protein
MLDRAKKLTRHFFPGRRHFLARYPQRLRRQRNTIQTFRPRKKRPIPAPADVGDNARCGAFSRRVRGAAAFEISPRGRICE